MIGNPKLREKSSDVTDFGVHLQQIIQDLKDTLTHLQKTKKIGRALAAPQINYLKKVIFFGLPDTPFVMINPKITWKSEDKFWVWDSCFSFDVAFFVEILRHKKIKVEYLDARGELEVNEFNKDLSELVQHEIEHKHGDQNRDELKEVKMKIVRRKK